MERITLYLRTTKTSGKIKLRFRLTEGREVQLFHKSNIEADLADLKKFDMDGSLKPRVSVYNKSLCSAVAREIEAMKEAYTQLKEEKNVFDATDFEARIDMVLNPEKYNISNSIEAETLLVRFNRYIDGLKTYGTVSEGRVKIYKIVWDKLSRYLLIFKKSNYTPEQFSPEEILAFREFVINEYKYVDKHRGIYGNLPKISVPTKQASINTASAKLRALQAFFNELEDNDEILKSPFRRLTKKRRNEALREQYDDPFFLRYEEVQQIMATEVPETLRETKDAFLLQCALGCRIGDYFKLSMSNVAVTDDGIPYIQYLPKKTMKTQNDRREKKTPLMLFALEIVKRTGFKFGVLKYASGKSGYNAKIKKLLEYCKIDRLVNQYDEASGTMNRVPLHTVGSSKLCRKTHVDIANKAQVNMYATGLHEIGSSAVDHYSMLEIKDLFTLLCVAFNQPQYRVDKDLDVIQED
ncbi:hypothetical protein [Bacteroides acidifaciens]|uniref:hypothetical protein n=2 Tax=Bacteroides acidifaciens TaxID=85831 RepID=UPI0026EBA1D8|nr:hypothetical protein [Bacteroides acidifaciens]